ncbi:MAG: hypothetical protein WED82_01870 [Balneolales bacterium]
MDLTLFEKNIIHQALNAMPTGTIGEVERILAVKPNFDLTKEEAKIVQAADISDKPELDDSASVEISIEDMQLIWNKMKQMTGFPVHPRSIQFKTKMEALNGKS